MTALAADKRALAATARMGWAASAHDGHEDTVTAGVSATAADNAQAEMMLLLIQTLRASPCVEAAKKLEEEADRLGVFGTVTNWSGAVRARTFEDVRRAHTRVGATHLQRLAWAAAQQERVTGPQGPGDVRPPHTLLRAPAARLAATAAVLQHSRVPMRGGMNEVLSLRAREVGVCKRHKWRPQLYQRIEYQASIMGHFCAVYCLTFDRTGLRYITGSDDKLIKIWQTHTGLLLRSLRGHMSDILDLAVSCDNRFLASCSNDMDVRVWWLHSGAPLAVLPGHTDIINSVSWSPFLRLDMSQEVYSWSLDGSLRIWSIDTHGTYTGCTILQDSDSLRPSLRGGAGSGVGDGAGGAAAGAVGRSAAPVAINCAAFHVSMQWVALGGADTLIRIFLLHPDALSAAAGAPGNRRPLRLSGHTGEVEHLMTSGRGDLLVSGSSDGSVRLWPLVGAAWPIQVDYQRARVLNIRTGEQAAGNINKNDKHKLSVVVLTIDGACVVTAQQLEKRKKDGAWLARIKVWEVATGELVHNFNQHHDAPVHVLEAHPLESRLVASAGYDARVYFWDVVAGVCVARYQLSFRLDDRLNPVSFDANSADIFEGKWHPDGMAFVTTHKNGFTSTLSVSNHTAAYGKTPREQFFKVDFGELVMDQQRNVIDRAAQVPPHTLPNGAWCDRFGTEYAAESRAWTASDRLLSRPLLVSPPRAANHPAAIFGSGGVGDGGGSEDAMLAAALEYSGMEDDLAEGMDMQDASDSDFIAASSQEPSDDERDTDFNGESRAARRARRQQTERQRRAAALAARRERRTDSRRQPGARDSHDVDSGDFSGDHSDSYSEGDLSDSELFVPRRGNKPRSHGEGARGGRARVERGWQPEQQRRRALTQAELDKNIARSRAWLLVTDPPAHVDAGYVPQLGDVVVYFVQGHQEQLMEYPEAQCQRAQQPWEELALGAAEKCEVIDIKYQIPASNEPACNSVYCLLLLKRLSESLALPKAGRKFAKGQPVKARWMGAGRAAGHRFPGLVEECNEDGTYVVQFDDGDREEREPEDMMVAQTFVVAYRHATDLAEFVLPLYRYERFERNVYGPGDRFKMFYEDSPEPYTGTVLGMRPFHPKDFPDSPWQCLEVRWDIGGGSGADPDECSQVSPWEIMPLSEEPAPPALTSRLSEADRSRILSVLRDTVLSAEVAAPFIAPPAAAELAHVPLPLCLRTIIARLEAFFYHSRDQVRHDLGVICGNPALAARPDERLVRHARALEPVFDAVCLDGDVAAALERGQATLAQYPAEQGAAAGAAAGGGSGAVGAGEAGDRGLARRGGTRGVVAKVSPESLWKSTALTCLDNFHSIHGDLMAGWSAPVRALGGGTGVDCAKNHTEGGWQDMVVSWTCCEYATVRTKVATGEYSGQAGANLLAYDLLSLCIRLLLLSASPRSPEPTSPVAISSDGDGKISSRETDVSQSRKEGSGGAAEVKPEGRDTDDMVVDDVTTTKDEDDAAASERNQERGKGEPGPKRAREALRHALSLTRALKLTHPQACMPSAVPRAGRGGENSGNTLLSMLQTVVALDPKGLLGTVPTVVLCEDVLAQVWAAFGKGGVRDSVGVQGLQGMQGLSSIVTHAGGEGSRGACRYSCGEDMAVDLLVVCSRALLSVAEESEEFCAAAAVIGKALLVLPRAKTISLKISLGKGGHSANDIAKEPGNELAVASGEGGRRQSSGVDERAARAALRHKYDASHEGGAVGGANGEKAQRTGAGDGEAACGLGRVGIHCPGVRDWLRKALTKLRATNDSVWVFEDPVTDDVAPGYSRVISVPVCFRDIEARLGAGDYDALPQKFVTDVLQIVANALTFNEPGDVISTAAVALARRAINIFSDKVTEWNTLLESLCAANGKARVGFGGGVGVDLQARLMGLKAIKGSDLFAKPIRDSEVPGYSTVIRLPMDLSTMQASLSGGRYVDECLMRLDALLIGVNCCLFNGGQVDADPTKYYEIGRQFLTGMLALWKPKLCARAAGARGDGGCSAPSKSGRRTGFMEREESGEEGDKQERIVKKRKRAGERSGRALRRRERSGRALRRGERSGRALRRRPNGGGSADESDGPADDESAGPSDASDDEEGWSSDWAGGDESSEEEGSGRPGGSGGMGHALSLYVYVCVLSLLPC